MKLRKWLRKDRRSEQRIDLLVELTRRRDHLMRARKPDLEALEQLADDYDAAGLTASGANLASRLEWFRMKDLEESERSSKNI